MHCLQLKKNAEGKTNKRKRDRERSKLRLMFGGGTLVGFVRTSRGLSQRPQNRAGNRILPLGATSKDSVQMWETSSVDSVFLFWRDSRKMKGNWDLGKKGSYSWEGERCHEFVLRVFVLFVEETEENEGTAKRALFGGVVREFKRLEKGQVHLWLEML